MNDEENFLRLVLSLYLPAFSLSLGGGIASPVVPLFAKSFGVSFGVASLVVTMPGVGRVVTDLPIGFLIDRIGRRPTVLLGVLLTAMSTLASGLAQSFVELLAYRTVTGIGMSMWEDARQTIIADAVAPRLRGRVMSNFMVVSMAGMTVGPVVGGIVASVWGLRSPFFFHSSLAFICTIICYALIKETKTVVTVKAGSATSYGSIIRLFSTAKAALIAFGFAAFVIYVRISARDATVPFFGTYVLNVGLTEVGLLLAMTSVGMLIFAIPSGLITDRLGRKKTLVPGMLLTGLAYLLYGFAGDYTQALFASILWGVGSGVGAGVIGTMSLDMAPANARGLFISIWRLIADLGFIGGPLLAGAIMDMYDIRSAFLAVAALILLGTLTAQLFVKETLKRTA